MSGSDVATGTSTGEKTDACKLECGRAARLKSPGFARLRFALFIPAAKIERDRHAGSPQLVR